jgi:hypothetical protein
MNLLPPMWVALIGHTVQRVYAVGKPPEGKLCFFRGLKNVVVLPAVGAYLLVSYVASLTNPPSRRAFTRLVPCRRRFGWVRMCMVGRRKCSQLSSDTYDVYFGNPGLIPQLQTDPMEANQSDPWTLDDEHGDATVEDICDFIVEYINSDVMVCLSPALVPLSSCSLRIIGPFGGPAHRHCGSIQGGIVFAYSLLRTYPPIGRSVRRAVHEACQAL